MLVLFACTASILLLPVICNTIGSSLLQHIHPTSTYAPWDAAQTSAMGSAILLLPYLLVASLLNELVHNSHFWTRDKMSYLWLAVGTINSPAAGALGAAILHASAGKIHVNPETGTTTQETDKIRQTVIESAAAGGLGAGIWIAAWLALVLVLGGVYGLLVLVYAGRLWIHDKRKEEREKRVAIGLHQLDGIPPSRQSIASI